MDFEYILEARDLTYSYEKKDGSPMSLKGVSLGIRPGVRTVILGANGAGKSTLFYHFNGVFKPKSGEVLYRGIPLCYDKEILYQLREDIAVVVQREDGGGAELALRCAASSGAAVVFVPAGELSAAAADRLAKGGVFVLPEGVRAPEAFVFQLAAIRAAYGAIIRENAGLRRKVLEAQAVGRAKCLLVERRRMTEQAAHKFIEKTAMDNRLTRYAVAKDIIRGYERKGSSDGIGA